MTPEELASKIGLRGAWVRLITIWDGKSYAWTYQSEDGVKWQPYDDTANTVSLRHIGGPRDGEVDI